MNIIQKKLKNGLRVVLVPQDQAVTTTVLALVGVGSINENKSQNGISHFLEHMAFKQTKSFPNAKSLNEAFESIGAINNAFTSEEYTGYYAKSHPRHTSKIIELIGEIVLDTNLPKEEMDKEKGVVIEEINMYEDMPQYKVAELVGELMYGDTPVGRGIIGTKESVLNLSHKKLKDFYNKFYVAENTILTIVGNFNAEELFSQIKNIFGKQISGQKTEDVKVKTKTNTPKVVVKNKKLDQAHIAIAFPAYERTHKDSATISLLATILGGGMSSRLFQLLREEMGAAYYARAGASKHKNFGEFVIRAGVDTKRLKEVFSAIKEVLDDIKTNGVSNEELAKVKEFSIGILGMSSETTDGIASLCASSLFETGNIITPDMMLNRILDVKEEDILRVSKDIFNYKKVKIAVIGPRGKAEEIEKIWT